MSLLTISPSPHVRSSMTTQKIMLLVVLALVPAIVAATVVFGPRALFMVIYCAVISMFTELVCQRLMQKEVTVTDGSAMLTGVLLALNLPVTLPLWEAAIGCVFAVAVVKQLFGGLGCNFANPAITGRVFLLLSFGGDMTTWVKPFYYQGNNFIVKLLMDNPRIPDGVTGATPLASGNANLLDLFLGNVGGSLGETSALALLIGCIFAERAQHTVYFRRKGRHTAKRCKGDRILCQRQLGSGFLQRYQRLLLYGLPQAGGCTDHSAAADDCTGRDDNYRSTFGCQLQRKLCRHLQRDCIFSEHTQCAVYVCL